MTRSTNDRPAQTAAARRLDRLVGLARAADMWERLWRGLVPPLVVIGLFLCVSWLGLWLDVPRLARAMGVAFFVVLFAASTFGLWRVAPLTRRGALTRIDKASPVGHRPASTLEDRLAAAGRDPATDALWTLHLRRAQADAGRLKAGNPSPRIADLDRYAVRAGVVTALLACAIIAGPQRYARVAAAFDFAPGFGSAPGYRVDAWIDPPPYTGRPPVLLDTVSDRAHDPAHPIALTVPVGSTVVIRSSGGMPQVETSGPLLPPPTRPAAAGADGAPAPAPAAADGSTAGSQTQLILHGDSKLVIRHGSSIRGSYVLTAIPDQPPQIFLRAVPKSNARGSLTLAYSTSDDYGVASAEAQFSKPKLDGEPTAGPSLVDPPKMPLSLPGMTHGLGDGETTGDLSEHPWAGARVTMVLSARDEGGNEGRSDPVEITLPQKPFNNPLARALVEQRRMLVLEPGKRDEVARALDALMIAPEAFGTSAGVYLGLRYAADILSQAQTKPELVAVADFLWGMALQIENGDLSDAERALRNAEKELRDAIDRHASPEEIEKLTQNLQAAMDKFLKELAEQQKKGDQQQAANQGRPSKSVSQRDLQKLIDQLKQQAKSGNREEAKKALDELQDILENLKTAKQQKADPQQRAMAESLNQLDQMMRDQQDLRDETYKQGQQQENQFNQGGDGDQPMQQSGRRGARGRQNGTQGQGAPGMGQGGQGGQGSENGDGESNAGGQQGRGGGGQKQGQSLGSRQDDLRRRLAEIQKKLDAAGQGERALGDANDAMREAQQDLQGGEGNNGQAVDAQGRALDALRQGAKKLAESMAQQGEQNGGQANGEGEGTQGSQDGQQSNADDPLGRPRGGNNTLNSASRFDPLGVPAAQRAQRVLEELRRRLGDPARAQEEIDYLERLLHSY